MRESTAASIAQRLVKAATRMAGAVTRGAENALAGILPQPQPQLVPVRVRAHRS